MPIGRAGRVADAAPSHELENSGDADGCRPRSDAPDQQRRLAQAESAGRWTDRLLVAIRLHRATT